MSFFPEAITYIIGETLQKENPFKQNIVSLTQKKHFSCKRLVHKLSTLFPS